MKVILMLLISTIFAAVSTDCTAQNATGIAESHPDKLIYQFKDSSVPPPYHRSYTITATKFEAKIAVSDYSKVLNEAVVALDEKRFDEIVQIARAAKITRQSGADGDGCTGGTGESLAFFKDEKQIFSASVYHCGDDDYGDLKGDTAAVKAKLKSLFPELEKTLK